MPSFEYKVQRNGTIQAGVIDAESLHNASLELRKDGGTILSIRQGKATAAKASGSVEASNTEGLLIPKSQIEMSLRQLSSLLRAGVPIIASLEAVSEQSTARLGRVYRRVTEKVRRGYAMKRTLEEEAPFFGPVTIGLIDVGEANGTLDEMFAYSATLMERARKIRGQIVQAFSYPAIVFLVAMGIAYFLVVHVLPKIMEFITKQSKAVELPLPTRMLMQIYDFLMAYGVFVMLAPFAIVAVFVLLRRNPDIRERLDCAMLYIPLLGKAFREHSNTMWCQTLGALIKSGVDILVALELVEGVMSNRHYAVQIRKVREIVKQGGSLSKGIESTTLAKLCPMCLSMVSVSEKSGNTDTSLLHVAEYCEEQLTRRVTILGKFVEPALFVVIGGIVGFIYFAFFLAMMATTNAAA